MQHESSNGPLDTIVLHRGKHYTPSSDISPVKKTVIRACV